jgi:hypothetical protein
LSKERFSGEQIIEKVREAEVLRANGGHGVHITMADARRRFAIVPGKALGAIGARDQQVKK